MRPKIIRDPIHNIVPFDNSNCDELLLSLINTKEFQRLRRIRQLGMCDLVFPGASHSRFSHSIGVMRIAKRILERIEAVQGKKLDELDRKVTLVSALLHDIGHGPFSHAFEKITKKDHERYSVEMILNQGTEVHKELLKVDSQLPSAVASFLSLLVTGHGTKMPNYLKQIVSSQLDADRFDYLLRDSHFTGTEYGKYDLEWLVEHLLIDSDLKILYLDRKSIPAIEGYIFARFHMYRAVYFHKTVRSAEIMLRLLFKRIEKIVKSRKDVWPDILPDAPKLIVDALSGENISINDYIKLDDAVALSLCHACRTAKDPILSALGCGLLDRKLYKSIELPSDDYSKNTAFRDAVRKGLENQSEEIEYLFIDDSASDTPYRPYEPDQEAAAISKSIFVENAGSGLKEISQTSEAVQALTKKYQIIRHYFPERLKNIVDINREKV
ncbi:MAG: HD domain-containing protein [Nitrospinae bacterium]|nr:HD domain-containing protein [Nitrospinota bacterium]